MSNKWNEWKGGECPVSSGTFVEVKFRSKLIDLDEGTLYSWNNDVSSYDIIAWKYPDNILVVVIDLNEYPGMGEMTTNDTLKFIRENGIDFNRLFSSDYRNGVFTFTQEKK